MSGFDESLEEHPREIRIEVAEVDLR